MPKKVLDEDQLRRKASLAARRAARKKAKEEAQAAQREAEANKDDDEGKDNGDSSAAAASNVNSENQSNPQPKPCYLWNVPEEAMGHLLSYLTAPELAKLLMTGQPIHKQLPNLRAALVLSRLLGQYSGHKSSFGGTQIVHTLADAQDLVDQITSSSTTTTRKLPHTKVKLTANAVFVDYLYFIEQVHPGGYLAMRTTTQPNYAANRMEGRFVSASPEHSVVRVGGQSPGGSGLGTWGVGQRGQLGHGQRVDQALPPRRLVQLGYHNPLPDHRIVQVAAGGGLVRVAHTLLLSNSGRVYSFGTGQYGALGHGYSAAKQLPDVLRPTLVRALTPVVCTAVAAGELHSAALTADGDLYTWGDGFCGQLGHGNRRPQVLPLQVESGGLEDECLATISCGCRHTVVISEEGEVFTFGLGHFGVLGRSFTPFDHDAEAALANLGGNNDEDDAAAIPAFAPFPDDGPPPPPAQEDQVANNSNNNNGMADELRQHLDLIANLSLEDSSDQCLPKLVDSLTGIRIVQGSAGHRHTLLVDEQGGVYSCGAGTFGCLGHGDMLSQRYPVRISTFWEDDQHQPVRIHQVSAGVDMSMAVSTKGEVYAWGKPHGGRLGLGLLTSAVMHPRKVHIYGNDRDDQKKGQAPSILPALEVDCGYVHSLIVAVDGTVHLCGNVGIEGRPDNAPSSQRQQADDDKDNQTTTRPQDGLPTMIPDFCIWHRMDEPTLQRPAKPPAYKKYGKYEIKGRSKMLSPS